MNNNMKQNFIAILAILFLALTFGACESDNQEQEIKDPTLLIEVKMPDKLSVEGVKGSLAYYWNKQHFLHLQIAQEGRESKVLVLKPTSIPSEGDMANFRIELSRREVDLNRPITLSGAVMKGDAPEIKVGGGVMITPKKFGGLLAYDLLKDLDQPLRLEPTTTTLKGSLNKLSIGLKAEGQLLFFQLLNGEDESIQPKSMQLSAKQELFLSDDAKYNPLTGKFEGTHSTSTPLFQFQAEEKLAPQLTSNNLLWLPESSLKDIELAMEHLTTDDKTVESKANITIDSAKPLPLIFVQLDNKGVPNVDDKPIIDEADTSEGGDPLFTMDDIEFWVGEGDNRAALVIEWHDDKKPDALVWGYRWDGEQTGYDMVKAVVKADPRLSFLMGKAFGGLEVIGGIGYQFKATDPRAYILLNGEKQPNDGNGITYVETAKDFDHFTFSDSEGHWKSGFYTNGYWVYYVKDNRLDSWSYSQLVYSLRNLVDGCWDGWSFQDGMESYVGRPLGNKFVPAMNLENK